jgi:FemAB-related protein (PEP-CTERM system-associated)
VSGIKTKIIEPSDEANWRNYVLAHPAATHYHRLAWKQVMETSFGHRTYYLMAEQDDRTVGMLPIVHIESRLFGSMLCSMPFLNFGGIVADDAAAEAALLDEARRLLQETGAEHLELRHLYKSSTGLPCKTHKVSMSLELDPDPEVIWKSFKSKHRRHVIRGLDHGYEITFGGLDLLDDYYAILSQGWRNLGTPIYAKSFFKNILTTFGDAVEIAMVTDRGVPVATALNGIFKGTAEGMWTYSLREDSRSTVNYFLYWSLIKSYCERGCDRLHMGRSTVGSQGQAYKSRWKAVPHQLYWEYLLARDSELPDMSVDNPKYRLAINAWRKLPVRATQMVGPYLAKSIP